MCVYFLIKYFNSPPPFFFKEQNKIQRIKERKVEQKTPTMLNTYNSQFLKDIHLLDYEILQGISVNLKKSKDLKYFKNTL